MRKIKFNFGILAALIGLSAAFAFKAPAVAKTKTADVWYLYNGGDQSNPVNYTKISGTPTCNSSTNLCAIEGPDNGLHPTQTTVDSPDAERFKN
jgi:hypothetical protein